MCALKKMAGSQQGRATTLDSEPEHVIKIIERPSQMMKTTVATPQSSPVVPRPPSSLRLKSHPARVPSSAAAVRTAGAAAADVNDQLVERIDQLYRLNHQPQHAAAAATVWCVS